MVAGSPPGRIGVKRGKRREIAGADRPRSCPILEQPAFAQTANIEGVLQNIVNMLTGNVARLLATLAVIIVGIAWMFGYLDLRKAAYVVLGVAITFGASEVVSTLTGGH